MRERRLLNSGDFIRQNIITQGVYIYAARYPLDADLIYSLTATPPRGTL